MGGLSFAPREFSRLLLPWYDDCHRDLPWRRTKNPYEIWVSEVMLQQTRVDTVLPYYRRFLQRFPRLEDLARADGESVLKQWENLGYYARARNLHRACQLVAQNHKGRVPDNWKDFRALPGVGDYIAAAVLSMAFDRPLAVVDGNVKRVLARIFLIPAFVNAPKNHPVFAHKAQSLLAAECPGRFNQAVMELGALVCTPKGPDCENCPVSGLCLALTGQAVLEYPKRKPSAKRPTREMGAAVITSDRQVLISRRAASGLLGGMWEPVMVALDKKTDPASACKRHLEKNLSLSVADFKGLGIVRHEYTHFSLKAHVFAGRASKQAQMNGIKWVDRSRLAEFPFHRAAQKIMELAGVMEKRLQG